MFEGILNTIGSIFGPVRDVIDDVHTSREEKERLKQELLRIELDARSEAMKHIQKLAELQSRVVLGEIAVRTVCPDDGRRRRLYRWTHARKTD